MTFWIYLDFAKYDVETVQKRKNGCHKHQGCKIDIYKRKKMFIVRVYKIDTRWDTFKKIWFGKLEQNGAKPDKLRHDERVMQ